MRAVAVLQLPWLDRQLVPHDDSCTAPGLIVVVLAAARSEPDVTCPCGELKHVEVGCRVQLVVTLEPERRLLDDFARCRYHS